MLVLLVLQTLSPTKTRHCCPTEFATARPFFLRVEPKTTALPAGAPTAVMVDAAPPAGAPTAVIVEAMGAPTAVIVEWPPELYQYHFHKRFSQKSTDRPSKMHARLHLLELYVKKSPAGAPTAVMVEAIGAPTAVIVERPPKHKWTI